MKRALGVATILALLATPVAVRAEEAESPFTVTATASVLTDYMYRGFNLYDGVSIQPSITASYSFGDWGSLSANYWMHLSAEGDRKAESFTESDETVSYSFSAGPAAITIGHVWYTYPDDSDAIKDSAEVFASVAFDTVANPTLSVYHDYREYDAQYYELGFNEKFEPKVLGEGFNITPFVAFGFASSAESIYDDNGLVQVTEGVFSELSLGDVAVKPTINYTHKVDDATTNEFWMGTTFSYSF